MEKKSIIFEYEEYSSKDELNAADRELLEQSLIALTHASPQFSHFNVGAAARLSDGTIHTSANKENTSIITCAEQNLLLHLHSVKPDFIIEAIAVSFQNMNPDTLSDFPITPCGKCRQLLLEAEDNGRMPIRVIMAGQSGKIYIATGVYSMLPLAYNKLFLQMK
jgi:cytidine deaminase